MLEEARLRTRQFQKHIGEHGIDVVLLTDESSIAYFAGFWGYLGVEFGRPTFLVLKPDAEPAVITPLMESEMVRGMTWVDRVLPWADEGGEHWSRVLQRVLGASPGTIHVEKPALPGLVRDALDEHYAGATLADISPLLAEQRAVKSPWEIEVMKQAGRVGRAMMDAARDTLGEGVPEYEVALAVQNAGTRAAAACLSPGGWDEHVSPVIHNLQIMQSGRNTAMVHRRAGIKRLERGDPVYFCFCNLLELRHYRLGFDRVFFIGEADTEAAAVQETANEAQRAALSAVRPGARASEVAAAANDVYRRRGVAPGYRTGRSIGMAYLEAPELKQGDDTVLRAGMTFAVDGGVTVPGSLGGRIGDSIVVTDDGFEFITDYPRELLLV